MPPTKEMLMIRVLFPLVLVAALACGGESPPVSDAVEGAKDVAAQAGDAAEAQMGAAAEMAESGSAALEEMTNEADNAAMNCLGLVSDGNFQAAIPACTEALRSQPANLEVQRALETAKSGAAKAAAADPAGAASKMLQ